MRQPDRAWQDPANHLRRMGARVLHRLSQCAGEIRRGLLESRQLGFRRCEPEVRETPLRRDERGARARTPSSGAGSGLRLAASLRTSMSDNAERVSRGDATPSRGPRRRGRRGGRVATARVLSLTLAALVGVAFAAACGKPRTLTAAERGEVIYRTNCISCHNRDPDLRPARPGDCGRTASANRGPRAARHISARLPSAAQVAHDARVALARRPYR